MPAAYLIETDTVSYSVRGSSPILRMRWNHAPADQVYISTITVAELLFGTKKLPVNTPLGERILSFVRSANVLDWDIQAAQAYADIRHTLSSSGQLIGELDMMIAAHALATGCILVSNNTRHFSRLVPPLQLENWTEP